jgi:dihydrofolate reductase
MGSTTYQWMLDHLLAADADHAQPWPYEHTTWVFTSRTLPTVPNADIRFVKGDVRPVHREMVQAAGGKNVWIVGGGDLAGQFHDHGLLDQLLITIAPVTLGGGAPLLPRTIAFPPLVLRSVRQYGAAYAELVYDVPRATRA